LRHKSGGYGTGRGHGAQRGRLGNPEGDADGQEADRHTDQFGEQQLAATQPIDKAMAIKVAKKSTPPRRRAAAR
jgi:hypothetical protein